ncbi:hypothetical protein [Ferruginibacter sp. SUN106]|uniref:hypothetical protein n=1 Tax=Ferruginibacter sp. SUN106 TaxID=2978348 RepID=UPI003D36D9A9
MPVLKITRSDESTNRMRNIKIFLDGTLLGTIKNAETKDFEITAGEHLLQAKIDWCSSPKISFSILANATKAFSMTSFAKNNPLSGLALIYYTSFGAGKFLQLQETPPHG